MIIDSKVDSVTSCDAYPLSRPNLLEKKIVLVAHGQADAISITVDIVGSTGNNLKIPIQISGSKIIFINTIK